MITQNKNTKANQKLSHLLLSEKEENLQHSIALMLKQAYYRVSIAKTTQEAIQTIEMHLNTPESVDLLIADLDSPKAETYQYFLDAVSSDRIPAPYLIIAEELTADTCSTLMAKGCAACITKPFEAKLLLESIETALRSQAWLGKIEQQGGSNQKKKQMKSANPATFIKKGDQGV